MTAQEIKQAVDNGKTVFWKQENYKVVKDNLGQYLIECDNNGHCIGLTWTDGTTLNGKEEDFFILPAKPMYYIETWHHYKGKLTASLVNIDETPYQTKEEAEAKIKEDEAEDEADYQDRMQNYESRLESFVMDQDTEDTEPRQPHRMKYTYKAVQYILTEKGFEEPDNKIFFVKDRSGRGGSSECSHKLLIELYGEQEAENEDEETVKAWAETADIGDEYEVDGATTIIRIK